MNLTMLILFALYITACWSVVVSQTTYSCAWCTAASKCTLGNCPSGYGLASDNTCQGKNSLGFNVSMLSSCALMHLHSFVTYLTKGSKLVKTLKS